MTSTESKISAKEFINKILAGLSIGIIVSLIPGALLGELSKALLPAFPSVQNVINITNLAQRMLPIIIGITISMEFKFTPIQASSVGIATLVGSGVASAAAKGTFNFAGTGDVINAGLTAAIAAGLVLLIGNRLKAYTVLLVPTIVIIVAGLLGLVSLPYVKLITKAIGDAIVHFTALQPVLMCILTSLAFSLIIVSPLSTVAIASAISLTGIVSAAANLGIVAAGFGLAIAGWSLNSFGTSIAHFLGTPKIQMANFVKKPQMIIPMLCNSAILGALAAIFNIKGTPASAGFGISGLIGPVNALNLATGGWSASNILLISIIFIVVPVIFGFIFNFIFTKVVKLVEPSDYRLDYK